MFIFLMLGAAALLYLAKPSAAKSLARIPAQLLGMSATYGWPKQRTAALDQGKHYFFALPIFNDMKATKAGLESALATMGWSNVKTYPMGADMSTADSPHPDNWASYKGLRASGVWTGSPGSMFNVALVEPFGASDVTLWMNTETFVAMHAMRAS